MPQEDDGASELDHPEEIFWVVFPANDGATKVMKPGEQALDFPATPVAAQNPAVLRRSATRTNLWGAMSCTPYRSWMRWSSGSLS